MRLSILVLSFSLVACTAAKPASDEKPAEAPTPVEEPAPRVAPQLSAEFEGFEAASPVDLGSGWLALGVSRETGEIRAVYSPDEGPSQRRERVAVQEDTSCDQGFSVRSERKDPYVLFWVECQSGEDALVTTTTAFVLTGVDDLDAMRTAWTGVVGVEESNQVTGCFESNNAELQVRGTELWLVTDPFAQRSEGYEDVTDDFGPCSAPGEPSEEQVL